MKARRQGLKMSEYDRTFWYSFHVVSTYTESVVTTYYHTCTLRQETATKSESDRTSVKYIVSFNLLVPEDSLLHQLTTNDSTNVGMTPRTIKT